MDTTARRTAEKWARIIAGAYADRARPPLSPERCDQLATRLAERLVAPIERGDPGQAHVNLVLNQWERRVGGEGPHLSLDILAGSVRMGIRPVGR